MRDACVMQGRAPTPPIPPGRRHACTGAVRSLRRCITQRCLPPRQQHSRHNPPCTTASIPTGNRAFNRCREGGSLGQSGMAQRGNSLGANTVANMRTPLKGGVRQCSLYAAEQCSPMFAVRQNVRLARRIAVPINGSLDIEVGRVRSPSWQQELTPAVTAMDAAKLGMAPMEGTCRAGR